MLKKLLKYDLKNMYKFLISFYVLAIFFGLTTRLFFNFEQTAMISIIGQISVGCMFAMIANILINNLMRCWIRFSETIYKDESYLTHTLPISKSELYSSKFLTAFITLITSFIVIILTLVIAYYSKENFIMLKQFVNNISGIYDVNSIMLIFSLILILFLELINALQSGYLGMILGYKKNNNQTIYSVLFGFIVYLLSQFFILIVIYLIGIFNSDIMLLFTSNELDSNLVKMLIPLSITIYTLICIIMYSIALKKSKEGVNVI